MYTSGEDLDWNEMGLDKEDEEDDPRHKSASPPSIPEENEQALEQPEWAANKVQNWTEVIRQDAPKRTVSSPVVTYAQRSAKTSLEQLQTQPQVRRKSSELSATMRERLEAFNAEQQGAEERATTAGPIEPDQQFHKKLMAFRKISEGKLEPPAEALKPKPPQSISSLLAGGVSSIFFVFFVKRSFLYLLPFLQSSQSRSSESPETANKNEEYENDTLDDVDQLLDDALEESYRSVLEEKDSHLFRDKDFAGPKAPPSEKPPPPPEDKREDEIDQQEREIIASLEMEEREHNRYIMEKMKRLPTPSSAANSTSATAGDSGIGSKPSSESQINQQVSNKKSSIEKEVKNNYNNAQRKRTPNEQR